MCNIRKYAAIVFLASLRFETSKRKLQHLNFGDFLECAQAIMTFWTYTYQHTGPEYYDTEMDKEFLLDLRELRCLLEKEKEIKQLVYTYLNLCRNYTKKSFHIFVYIHFACSLVSIRLKPMLLDRAHQELDTNFRFVIYIYIFISNDPVYYCAAIVIPMPFRLLFPLKNQSFCCVFGLYVVVSNCISI